MSTKTDLRKSARATAAYGLATLAIGIGTLFVAGCGYPEISPAAVELALVVENLCNLKNEDQVSQARELVEEKAASGEISERERDYLFGILDEAEEGDWEGAQRMSRRLLEDQWR